jgi:hypothetical protein
MESNTAFERSTRIVVLNTKALEDPRRPIVHADGNKHAEFAHGRSQQLGRSGIEPESESDTIELILRFAERCPRAFRFGPVQPIQ